MMRIDLDMGIFLDMSIGVASLDKAMKIVSGMRILSLDMSIGVAPPLDRAMRIVTRYETL